MNKLIFFFLLILLCVMAIFGGTTPLVESLIGIILTTLIFISTLKINNEKNIYLFFITFILFIFSIIYADGKGVYKFISFFILPIFIYQFSKNIGYRDFKILTFFLSSVIILLLYPTINSLDVGYEYREGFWINEDSRIYKHVISGKLITSTGATGLMVMIALPISVIFYDKNIYVKIYCIFIFLNIIYFTYVFQSRNGYVFLALCLIIYLSKYYKKGLNIKNLSRVIFLLFLMLLILSPFELIPKRLNFDYLINVGFNNRIQIWRLYTEESLKSIFNFSLQGKSEQLLGENISISNNSVSAHNTFIEYLYHYGIIGLIYIITLTVKIFRPYLVNISNLRGQELVISTSAIVIFIYYNFESAVISSKVTYFYLFFFLGYCTRFFPKKSIIIINNKRFKQKLLQ